MAELRRSDIKVSHLRSSIAFWSHWLPICRSYRSSTALKTAFSDGAVRRRAIPPLSRDYQIEQASLRTIRLPSLQPNAFANAGMLEIGPFTRHLAAE